MKINDRIKIINRGEEFNAVVRGHGDDMLVVKVIPNKLEVGNIYRCVRTGGYIYIYDVLETLVGVKRFLGMETMGMYPTFSAALKEFDAAGRQIMYLSPLTPMILDLESKTKVKGLDSVIETARGLRNLFNTISSSIRDSKE